MDDEMKGGSKEKFEIDKIRLTELENIESQFKVFLENIQDVFYQADENGIIIQISSSACEMFGYKSVEEILGKKTTEFWVNPSGRDALVDLLNQNGKVEDFEFDLKRKDGTSIIVSANISLIRSTNGKFFGFQGLLRDITQKKQMEESLRETEEKFRLAFLTSPDAVNINRFRDGMYVDINDSFTQLTGYTREDVIGKTIDDVNIWFNMEDRNKLVKGLIEKGYYENLEAVFKTKTGSLTTALMSSRVIKINGIKHVLSITRDINERKKQEEALKESERVHRQVMDLVPDFIFAKDFEGRFLFVNKAVATAYGTTPEDLVGKFDRDFSATEEEANHFHKDDLDVINSGKIKIIPEERITTSIGEVNYLQTIKIPFSFGSSNTQALLGVATDITDRKRAQELLSTEKERLSVTLRSIGDGVITTGVDGKILMMNRVAEELTGWSHEDAVGKPLLEVFNIINEITKRRTENPIEIVLKTGIIVELANHTILISKDNKEYIIADSAAPIRDKDSRIIGVVLVFRDMTEKKKLIDSLQRTQKLDALGVLAGGIAHDFNNLLGGIFGYLDMIKLRIRKGNVESTLELINKILGVYNRAKGLTQQLLTFSKGGDPVRKNASIVPILKENTNFALSGSNVTCIFDLKDDLWLCDFDENQIGQVIDNLIINAQQSMPLGGTINISAENVSIDSHHVLRSGNYVKIAIKDNGTGIPKEISQRIFDPFFTTKQKGSGLGLATVYSILSKHDGFIDIESEIGKGSTFYFFIPAVKNTELNITQKDTINHRGKGRILVMEDEDFLRDIISSMLVSMGYEVIGTHNGKEAIDTFMMSRETNNRFKSIILDLTIPGGIGGQEVADEIRKIDSTIPIIVSTGYSENPIMANPSKYGFTERLQKPYVMNELAEVMENISPK